MMSKALRLVISLALVAATFYQLPAYAAQSALPAWAYDAGPDLTTPMGLELVDLNARIPYFPGVSKYVLGRQKFRPVFGPIPWRMQQKPNSVKILFIGQDGTHIAEAANRPATAGFGGRAQDLAEYFGVSSSAAFINTYSYTIRGQYGVRDAPIVHKGSDGKPYFTTDFETKEFQGDTFVSNEVWAITQDQESPIAQWRSDLIEWIIRNNPDSLKLIVLFGGASQDAAASFIESRGGEVESNTDLASVQVPELEVKETGEPGGNAESAILWAKDGTDLFAALFKGTPINYKKTKNIKPIKDAFYNAYQANPPGVLDRMVFSGGGLNGTGLLHPAQVGGYDLSCRLKDKSHDLLCRLIINGQRTLSLKGLKLKKPMVNSNDTVIRNDVLVVELPHPTRLTMIQQKYEEELKALKAEHAKDTSKPLGEPKSPSASDTVAKALTGFKAFIAKKSKDPAFNWAISPDAGLTNSFPGPYKYGRADMGPEYYDFGAPASRMVNVSSAVRMHDPADEKNVIIFGTRDEVSFLNPTDQATIAAMTTATPSQYPDSRQIWITRPRTPETRYIFDPGPGESYAKLMKENIPATLIQSHRANRDFGHYRGTFKNPRVVILADPHGYDDLITGRALTGTRGQYLHGLMEDLGVRDQYLVIKTAPFSQESDWETVFAQTKTYREVLIKEVLKNNKPELILADGPYAAQELERITGKKPIQIARSNDNHQDILNTAPAIKNNVTSFANAQVSGRILDIPRSHLPFYTRLWEGTSGDRVITSSNPQYRGKAFAVVAPRWAYTQQYQMDSTEIEGINRLIQKILNNGLRKGGESIPEYLNRTQGQNHSFKQAG